MWTCKHCKNEFSFETISEKANHSRWCDHNPKMESYRRENRNRIVDFHEKRYGDVVPFQVTCQTCSGEFTVMERSELFPRKPAYFCSRACANSVGGQAKSDKYHTDETANYTTVCYRHHDRKCCVCGFDKIVQVHHVDHNHNNNDPKNLVPLCPNHHSMWHSRFRVDIEDKVLEYINIRWAVSVVGDTRALQA